MGLYFKRDIVNKEQVIRDSIPLNPNILLSNNQKNTDQLTNDSIPLNPSIELSEDDKLLHLIEDEDTNLSWPAIDIIIKILKGIKDHKEQSNFKYQFTEKEINLLRNNLLLQKNNHYSLNPDYTKQINNTNFINIVRLIKKRNFFLDNKNNNNKINNLVNFIDSLKSHDYFDKDNNLIFIYFIPREDRFLTPKDINNMWQQYKQIIPYDSTKNSFPSWQYETNCYAFHKLIICKKDKEGNIENAEMQINEENFDKDGKDSLFEFIDAIKTDIYKLTNKQSNILS